MSIDQSTQLILDAAGLGTDAVWKHKQSGKYIAYHWALEVAAAKKGIKFSPPQVISADPANKIAVICVTGDLAGRIEWSIGEAAPYNTTQTYPFAMAEKRAKDRVILKLLGLSGNVYSEEEADDFKRDEPIPDPAATKNPPGITKFRQESREFYRDMYACTDYDQYVAFVGTDQAKAFMQKAINELPNDWNGDGGDVKGIKEDMRVFCESLKKTSKKEAA